MVQFFSSNTCRIEVVDAHGSLQRVYFPKPVVCNYITSITRDKVVVAVSPAMCVHAAT